MGKANFNSLLSMGATMISGRLIVFLFTLNRPHPRDSYRSTKRNQPVPALTAQPRPNPFGLYAAFEVN
jgi:hypothetical protein